MRAASSDNPTYEDVCSHRTGHAEVVEVSYDPDRVSYDDLLDVFWGKHNPTHKNRQGWDIGDQYRSVIFVHDEEQRAAAERSKENEQAAYRKPIATTDRGRADVLRGGGLPPAVPREARPLVLHAGTPSDRLTVDHRQLGVDLFNEVWRLVKAARTTTA